MNARIKATVLGVVFAAPLPVSGQYFGSPVNSAD
jgi:hypothetical protein